MTPDLSTITDGTIDAGLLLLELYDPRREWSIEEIAFVSGCSRQNIQAIERRAMAKLKPAFRERLTVNHIMNFEQINELEEPIWGVITHDRILASRVTYAEALATVESNPEISGRDITIVTIDVVDRMTNRAPDSEISNSKFRIGSGDPFSKRQGAI